MLCIETNKDQKKNCQIKIITSYNASFKIIIIIIGDLKWVFNYK